MKTSTTLASAEASELLSTLGRVVIALKRSPLPIPGDMHTKVEGIRPRPRHIGAAIQVALEGPLSVTELAERQKVSLATASQVVSDLVDLGMVQRVEDPTDRRRTLVEMTAEHRKIADAALKSRLKPLSRAMHRMTAEEQACLIKGLLIVADELEARETEDA